MFSITIPRQVIQVVGVPVPDLHEFIFALPNFIHQRLTRDYSLQGGPSVLRWCWGWGCFRSGVHDGSIHDLQCWEQNSQLCGHQPRTMSPETVFSRTRQAITMKIRIVRVEVEARKTGREGGRQQLEVLYFLAYGAFCHR